MSYSPGLCMLLNHKHMNKLYSFYKGFFNFRFHLKEEEKEKKKHLLK